MKQRAKFLAMAFLSWLTKKINGPYVNGLLVESSGLHFLVQATDMSVGRSLRFHGVWGEAEQHRIDKLINYGSTVAFIGTHIGSLAIPTALKVKKAIFVEANPKTYSFLLKNLAINQVKNVEAFNVAVGESKGEISFVLSTANSGGSKREPKLKDHMYYYDRPETIKVPMETFDSLVDSIEGVFDLVFMDIEGSEYFALKGMSATLQRTRNLVVEFIGHHIKNVAGVSLGEFLDLIQPHFEYLYIPSKDMRVERRDFSSVLSGMILADEDDEGLIFSKTRIY